MDQNPARSTRCTATCADGSPCRAWAVHGTDPPRCAPHGGGESPVGAPRGNQNALKHGFYAGTKATPPVSSSSAEMLIADLARKHAGLSRYAQKLLEADHTDTEELSRVLTLYSMNASRLARVLIYQRTHQTALDLLSKRLNLEL